MECYCVMLILVVVCVCVFVWDGGGGVKGCKQGFVCDDLWKMIDDFEDGY